MREKYWNIILVTLGVLWLLFCTLATFGNKELYYRTQSFTEDGLGIKTVWLFEELAGILFAVATYVLICKAYVKNKVVNKIGLLLIDLMVIESLYLFTQDYYKPFDKVKVIYLGIAIAIFIAQLYLIKYHYIIKKQMLKFVVSITIRFRKIK